MIEPQWPDIERRVEFAGSSEQVFEYLIDPAKLTSWQKGTRVIGFDPRRDGSFRLQTADGRAVRGRFLEVLPGRRLTMTWGYEHSDALPPEESTVEITVLPHGDKTVLHLLHRHNPVGTMNGGTGMPNWASPKTVEACG